VSLEQVAEKRCILISHGVTDFLHSAVVALEQALSRCDSQFLRVEQRAVSGCLLEPSNKITYAHAHPPGWPTCFKSL
jgi:hypothetical protein